MHIISPNKMRLFYYLIPAIQTLIPINFCIFPFLYFTITLLFYSCIFFHSYIFYSSIPNMHDLLWIRGLAQDFFCRIRVRKDFFFYTSVWFIGKGQDNFTGKQTSNRSCASVLCCFSRNWREIKCLREDLAQLTKKSTWPQLLGVV
jgi:hypothetical protein